MKTINYHRVKISFFLIAVLTAFTSMAQEKEVTTSTTTSKTEFHIQPWMWIVGGAVFILLLVAILKGGNNSKE